MDLLLGRRGDEAVIVEPSGPSGEGRQHIIDWAELPAWVAAREAESEARPDRWVWADTSHSYALIQRSGVRVRRGLDLRLAHAILTGSAHADLVEGGHPYWRRAGPVGAVESEPSLLDGLDGSDLEPDPVELLAEYDRQRAAVDASPRSAGLRLLLAAESVGALIAVEMTTDGLPFDVEVHDQVLTGLLGPRPPFGGRPAKVETLVGEIRSALRAPGLNPESAPELIKAMQRAGMEVQSSRQAELERIDHPVIAPLLEYKKLARLLGANGWHWMDTWVAGGRFRPDYVPGGVVSGRWATRGGGALQLPKQIRGAIRADPGWRLVVADAAQLEPRILCAMARDARMAEASRGGDLYQALVDQRVVDTRAHAKVAMLGALYGATSGRSGQLMERLTRAFPAAIAVVEDAARAGERFEMVSTWLGRSSPLPPQAWRDVRQRAAEAEAGPADTQLSRQQSRDWGRFTRNFVVQGSAAEWALCWMGGIRTRLRGCEGEHGRPHLVYFLHDEIIVHTPAACADAVAEAVRDAAAEAGRLLFADFDVEFALDVAVVDSYDQA